MVTLTERRDDPWRISRYIICPHCGREIRYFSYIIRNCTHCEKLFPINPLEIRNNVIQKCVYHFGKELNA